MIRRLALVLVLSLGTFAAMSAEPEDAAAQFRIGPHLGWNFDVEDGFVGADAWFGIMSFSETIQLHGNASFHWYFVGDNVSLWGIDINVPVLFKLGTDIVRPYAGIGLGIFHTKIDIIDASETDFAFNIIGGALFLADGRFNPYAQFRLYFSDGTGGEILGGVMFKF